MKPLVTADWLHSNLHRCDVIVLEADLPSAVSAGALLSHDNQGIPGAAYVDMSKQFVDNSQSLPHMLAPADKFCNDARELGINQGDTIVVYDRFGIYSSPRLRLSFKAMGHRNVSVLDGGLPAWRELGLPTAQLAQESRVSGDFEARGCPPVFCNAEFVLDASRFAGSMVVDARSAERFRGTAPEPRVGLRSGHIPDSLNLPFEAVLEYGRMRPYAVLRRLFEESGVTSKNLIFSCGSGVTACIPALAAEILGISDIRIYDGSWAEWGGREDLPIASS